MPTLNDLREAAGAWGDRASQFIHAVVWLRSVRRHRKDQDRILCDLAALEDRPDEDVWIAVAAWLRNEWWRHEEDAQAADALARWYGAVSIPDAVVGDASRWLDEHPGWIVVGEEGSE